MPDSTAKRKVIVTCAITGAIHTPTMSPHLPVTPDEIAESAIGAAQAGAAIVHLHARDPRDGRPTQDPALLKQFLPKIRAASPKVSGALPHLKPWLGNENLGSKLPQRSNGI